MYLPSNIFLILGFLALLPYCSSLACYYCASGLPGCNDPFNSTAYNVTNVSSPIAAYCVKTKLSEGVISRYGARTCSNVPFVGNYGKACCQTDLCNTAQSLNSMCVLFSLTFVIAILI